MADHMTPERIAEVWDMLEKYSSAVRAKPEFEDVARGVVLQMLNQWSQTLAALDAQQQELAERDRMLDETQQGQVFRDLLGQIEGLGRTVETQQRELEAARDLHRRSHYMWAAEAAHEDDESVDIIRPRIKWIDAIEAYDALRGEESGAERERLLQVAIRNEINDMGDEE